MTAVPRLTHVRVNVRSLPRAIEWYAQLFGVRPEGHWPPAAPTYVHFTLGPAQFALGEYEPAPSVDTPYGTRKFTIRDPDGNELGFVQS
ncbi:VOC family protein [Actinoplanes sp. NPDC051633]|uniref:VOC family protein n=1 Tax=Actinoplanes sp. NPDC051633 TaxID=3155670 RepID=UPI0034316315